MTKAILEYLVSKIGSKTLIATHYHELIQLEETHPGVKNYSVSVYETDKEVIFMKKIVKGGASKSYGLDVAKLAGIPNAIVERAKQHLNNYELPMTNDKWQKDSLLPSPLDLIPNPEYGIKYEKIKSLLQSYDLNNITPLQALQILDKVKDALK